ncbi:hydrolase [Aquimarina atlantica]|uniref:Hydrolase n=1 Tax=Aquimarina atlantica TaxID=1317122 RepID=A0A023C0M5_9FLAO|nr:alpha/beta fold hydrolase [Aquimarina atlantica]EZH75820.1 hydrolase [Aquimarina atlantica]
MHRLKKILLGGISLYCILLILLYFFQEKIIFQPEKLSEDFIFQFEHPFEEFFLETNDNSRLNAIRFVTKDPKGVMLYFHGNKGSLKRWGKIAMFFAYKKYDVIIMDYRGYGKSTGKISEQKLYEDAQLFYNYALERYPEDQITIYGRSIGTGIAVKVASDNRPNHLILETPYYSMKDVAESWLPFFPTNILLQYKIPSHEFIQNVICDITIYHGTDDKVVPYASGELLFNSISTLNKKMITIPKGSHNNLITFEEYRTTIDGVLKND